MCDLAVDLQLDVSFNTGAPKVYAANQSNGNSCVFSVELSAGAKGVPPIFLSSCGRPEHCALTDRRLRGAEVLGNLIRVIERSVSKFDPGNAVVAFAQAAKILEERSSIKDLEVYPVWTLLLNQLVDFAPRLEPRGLSMIAYSSAKLLCNNDALLAALVAAGTRRSSDFSATDIAKMSWAFAKFGLVDEEESEAFWLALADAVPSKICGGSAVDLSMLIWSFASVFVGDEAMFRGIASATLALPEDIGAQSLSNIVWAFAKSRTEDSRITSTVCRRAISVVDSFAEFDVSNMSWALAQLDAVDYELFDRLAAHTVTTGIWKRLSATFLSQLAWAFAVARFCHAALFDVIAEAISRHVTVFDGQHVAMVAWAFAAVGAHVPKAVSDMADFARGGKLWGFECDGMCALLWSLTRLRWRDSELMCSLVQVANVRTDELGGESLANLLSAVTTLRLDPGVDTHAYDRDIDALLDFTLNALVKRQISLVDVDALYMAVSCFCNLGRSREAWALFEAVAAPLGRSGLEESEGGSATLALRSYSVLMLDAERMGRGGSGPRSAAALAARLWRYLAADVQEPFLRASCMRSCVAAVAESGCLSEARSLLQELDASGLPNAALRRLSLRLGPLLSGGGEKEADDSLVAEAAASIVWAQLRHQRGDVGDVKKGVEEEEALEHFLQSVLQRVEACDVDNALNGTRSAGEIVLAAMAAAGGSDIPFDDLRLDLLTPARFTVLDDLLAHWRPSVVLEFGTRVGHTAVLAAVRMQARGLSDGRVVTVEENPLRTAVAETMAEVAGVARLVHTVVGPPNDCWDAVQAALEGRSADLVIVRGCEDAWALSCLEDRRLVREGCVVVIDHALRPGAFRSLWHAHLSQCSSIYSLDVLPTPSPRRRAGEASPEDWVAVTCRRASVAGGEVTAEKIGEACGGLAQRKLPDEIVALAVESDSLWRRLLAPTVRRAVGAAVGVGTEAQESVVDVDQFARRARAALVRLGLVLAIGRQEPSSLSGVELLR
eukprot:TRINITY_DN24951_c0_g1_i1.p1 TRINITY_DN24951_c0_g1~~TRINITY_DN24951_c0_g1_i1.p1  ORF type:complete len:1007 (+),score=138.54 TRINITY_DN24951_c0_g1_i1:36-3056(+)